VCLWKNIRNDWGNFSNLVSFKVGERSHISFWHDVWCGAATLKSSLLELYSISCNKEALVSNYLDSSGTSTHWNPSFTRAVQDWELESLDSSINLLYSSKTHSGEADRMLWTPANNHGFKRKSHYKSL
jgi:hypothetical protein